jgi:hypothetical protein
MSLEGRGQLIINANCSATSTVAIRGLFTVTDNAGGAVTLSDVARFAEDQNITTATGNVDGSVGSLAAQAKTDVNAEVVDVMRTDTNAELPQAIPPATPTFEEAVMFLYMALRNKLDITATLKEIHNDAGTVIAKKALSDDGTTYSETKAASGP